jgi:transposase
VGVPAPSPTTKRHGTTTLFAALNTLDGRVISMCQPRHRHVEWIKFLRLLDRRTPKHLSLHLIVDNYATHSHPNVQKWLAKHPRFIMHITPTSASWLNMVERFFRDITDKRIRRNSFTSVAELELAIDLYVAHHNIDPKPFIWTARATDILPRSRGRRRLSLPTRDKCRTEWRTALGAGGIKSRQRPPTAI